MEAGVRLELTNDADSKSAALTNYATRLYYVAEGIGFEPMEQVLTPLDGLAIRCFKPDSANPPISSLPTRI